MSSLIPYIELLRTLPRLSQPPPEIATTTANNTTVVRTGEAAVDPVPRSRALFNNDNSKVKPTCYRPLQEAESLKKKRRTTPTVISIAVFSGGQSNTLEYFNDAMGDFIANNPSLTISIEYATNKSVREDTSSKFKSPADLVRWCQSHSAYFLVSQGIWLGMVTSGTRFDGWTVDGISDALKQLAINGNGYPSGLQLDCPVWNGDKMRYFDLIPDFIIPTMKLDLINIDESTYSEVLRKVQR